MNLCPDRGLNPVAVRELLRQHEEEFVDALSDFGRSVGFTDCRRPFTGSLLCAVASEVVLDALNNNFGRHRQTYMEGFEVLPYDITHSTTIFELLHRIGLGKTHFRGHFLGDDGNAYFIDPTYGQMNSLRNRIIMDKVSTQASFYRLVTFPRKATCANGYRPPTLLEDYLSNKPPTTKQRESYTALFRVF